MQIIVPFFITIINFLEDGYMKLFEKFGSAALIGSLLMAASAVAAPRTVIAYDTDNVRRCFYADADGDSYGYSIEPKFCAKSYGVHQSARDGRFCYAEDADGDAFDYPVDPLLCQGRRPGGNGSGTGDVFKGTCNVTQLNLCLKFGGGEACYPKWKCTSN